MSNDSLQNSELWEISHQLISIDTVSAHSNVQAATYLADYLTHMGFKVQQITDTLDGVDKSSVLAWAGPEVADGLIISGHIDVVPFEGQPGWKSDPLQLQTDGEKIYGRGVSDMKVFLAQAVLAAKRYPINELKRPLMFIFTYDEEVAGQGSGRLVENLPQYLNGFPLPSIALIGEPTNFAIFPAHKGYATFDISVRGRGGHSSAPDQGLNAIDRMAEIIQLIKETNQQLRQRVLPENAQLFPDNPYTAFNNGVIKGGLAPNMIAETCQLTTSVRIAPGDNIEEIMANLQARIEQEISTPMKKVSPDYGVSFGPMIAVPPLELSNNEAFCQLLSKITGNTVGLGAPYATDGGQFQKLGIQSYICGPGLLEEAHQPNESLSIENFWRGQEILEQVIYEWCVKEQVSR